MYEKSQETVTQLEQAGGDHSVMHEQTKAELQKILTENSELTK